MKKNQKGFTLVELMIVVAIIGILAAVAIPKFADMLEKSREGATKGNLSAIVSGISLYVGDQQGQNPPALLDTQTATVTVAGVVTSFPGFLPQYMDSLPGVKTTAKAKSRAAAFSTWSSPAAATLFPGTWGGAATLGSGAGWRYDSGSPPGNNFWVNSNAGDMKSTSLTSTFVNSYTTYGYE